MASRRGQIIIAPDVNVWPHELETAKALAKVGHTVEFIRRSEKRHAISADALIDGLVWEMKAPTSGKTRMVEQNLRRATKQSENVVFDSRRMKGLPDHAIEREVRKQPAELKRLKRRYSSLPRHPERRREAPESKDLPRCGPMPAAALEILRRLRRCAQDDGGSEL